MKAKRRLLICIGASGGGTLGWMIGYTVLCLASGNADVWSRFAFTGFAVSLAIVGLYTVITEVTFRAFGYGSLFQLILWSELTFFVGVLLLLDIHWITPILEASPSLMDTVNSLGGGAYTISDRVPAALLSSSVILLAIVVVRLWRRNCGVEKAEDA